MPHWRPFWRDRPSRHIGGHIGCAGFVKIWPRGGLWQFELAAKNNGNWVTQTWQSYVVLSLPMPLWRPFRHDGLVCYIRGDVGCNGFVETQSRGGGINHWRIRGILGNIFATICDCPPGNCCCCGPAVHCPPHNNQPLFGSNGDLLFNVLLVSPFLSPLLFLWPNLNIFFQI